MYHHLNKKKDSPELIKHAMEIGAKAWIVYKNNDTSFWNGYNDDVMKIDTNPQGSRLIVYVKQKDAKPVPVLSYNVNCFVDDEPKYEAGAWERHINNLYSKVMRRHKRILT